MTLRRTFGETMTGLRAVVRIFIALALPLGVTLAAPARAEETELRFLQAGDLSTGDFLWLARLVVVFADSDLDPRYSEQVSLLEAGAEALAERDIVVVLDTDPAAGSAFRNDLRPRGFMMVLIGKDGVIRLRKPFPWNAREIGRSVDKIPLRQQEMDNRRATGSNDP